MRAAARSEHTSQDSRHAQQALPGGRLLPLRGLHYLREPTLGLTVVIAGVAVFMARQQFLYSMPALTWSILGYGVLCVVVIALAVAYIALLRSGQTEQAAVVFCAGLLGMQVAAFALRATSSVADLRATIETMRFGLSRELPGWELSAAAQLLLGIGLALQPLSRLHGLYVATCELLLFGCNVVLIYARTRMEALLTVWAPYHVSSFLLGLLLTQLAAGKRAEPADRKDAERENVLLTVLVALMLLPLLLPLANMLADFELQAVGVFVLP